MDIETEIKNHTYAAMDSSLLDNFNLISNRCSVEIDLIQEILGNLSHLIITISDVVLDKSRNTGNEDKPRGLILPLFTRNVSYLIASHKLMLLGLNNPSKSTLRTVMEGITQIYLVYSTKIEAELIYKKELDILTDDEINIFKNKYKYMPPREVRKLLYTGEKKIKIDTLYNEISNASHPTIKGIMSDIQLSDGPTNDTIYVILAFGMANIIAFLEVYSDKLDENTIENSAKLLDKCAKKCGGVVDLVPNHPSILEKLTLIPGPDLH